MSEVPAIVREAQLRASEAGFWQSSDDQVGGLLSVLAAAVPGAGRILELGTGTGVGTAWVVSGLAGRTDIEVVTVEANADMATVVQRGTWPTYVRFVVDDAVRALPSLGQFDLVFADAQGGKWDRLDLTIRALTPGGVLVVDDMSPQDWWSTDQAVKQAEVRQTLLGHPALVSCQLDWATGVILSAHRN